jgi:hypothetical protein
MTTAEQPVPRWVAPLFATLAGLTIPWTAYLAATLPRRAVSHHYRGAWVGFDVGLLILLLATAYVSYRGHRHVAIAASATATMLCVDAWFDVLTSPNRLARLSAGVSALLVELPLAVLCLWIALHADRVVARRMRQLSRRAALATARAAVAEAATVPPVPRSSVAVAQAPPAPPGPPASAGAGVQAAAEAAADALARTAEVVERATDRGVDPEAGAR